jgi:hypothetical protein
MLETHVRVFDKNCVVLLSSSSIINNIKNTEISLQDENSKNDDNYEHGPESQSTNQGIFLKINAPHCLSCNLLYLIFNRLLLHQSML